MFRQLNEKAVCAEESVKRIERLRSGEMRAIDVGLTERRQSEIDKCFPQSLSAKTTPVIRNNFCHHCLTASRNSGTSSATAFPISNDAVAAGEGALQT